MTYAGENHADVIMNGIKGRNIKKQD